MSDFSSVIERVNELELELQALQEQAAHASSIDPFMVALTVFVLACFIGYQVIWSVTPALHTPLMSVTNAISGIIVIGGMLQVRGSSAASLVGLAAVVLATINIAGGFLVTQRMLRMFHR